MKVTKYTHSCLLIERKGTNILIDPGTYSSESEALQKADLPKLDYVFITHIHNDHLDSDWLSKSLADFGNPRVAGNPSVVSELKKAGIEATSELPGFAAKHEWPHEELPWGSQAPPNWGFTFFDTLTHPGDSLRFDTTASTLALPVQAPWAHIKQAIESALTMKPQTIIPIHDWHWKDEARLNFYKKTKTYLDDMGVGFIEAEDGVSFEV